MSAVYVSKKESTSLYREKESLYVSFDYDREKVDIIKAYETRRYLPDSKTWEMPQEAIHYLKEQFGGLLKVDSNVDLDYSVPEPTPLDPTSKASLFEEEINRVTDAKMREALTWALNKIPDYFYLVPASTSGKHHPKYALGEGGLVRHTKALLGIAEQLFQCTGTFTLTEEDKNIIRFAGCIHDGCKDGIEAEEGRYAVDHPTLVTTYLNSLVGTEGTTSEVLDFFKSETWETVTGCVASHMGAWNKDFKGNEVLPVPKTKLQKFLHLCDYLASRKCLEYNFDAVE